MIRSIITIAAILLASPALAFNFESRSEPFEWTPEAKPRPAPKPQVRGFIQRLPAPAKPEPRCKGVISAIGDSARSEAAARLESQKAIKARIQWEYGNKFLALEHGEDLEYQCGPSSVPRFGGLAEQAASRFLPLESITCKITVRPCEAPVQRDAGK